MRIRELLELLLGPPKVIFRDIAGLLKPFELILVVPAHVAHRDPGLLGTVMDATAISLCMDNGLPIIVFNFREEGNIRRAVLGERIGTLVHSGSGR